MLKTPVTLVLTLPLLLSIGCHGRSTPQAAARNVQPTLSKGRLEGRAYVGADPGIFDYYVLNLSWSPEFCETHPDNHACAARPGFIVHGLWPQNNNGTYPRDCTNPARPTIAFAYLDLIPDMDIVQHEWLAHGTCSGLNPDAYFGQVRLALRSVEIPATFARNQNPPPTMAPAVLLDQLRQDNPAFPRTGFVVSCQNKTLKAIEACFDKNLNPTACRGLPSCSDRIIRIPSP